MNPLRDCQLRTHQTLRGHTRIFAKAYHLRPNNAGLSHVAVGWTMCYAGTKSARPYTAPLPEPRWGLTLAGLNPRFTSAPSRQIPSPRNSWGTSHTGQGTESPPGWSTRSCPTYGRFQHMKVTVFLNSLGRAGQQRATKIASYCSELISQ